MIQSDVPHHFQARTLKTKNPVIRRLSVCIVTRQQTVLLNKHLYSHLEPICFRFSKAVSS